MMRNKLKELLALSQVTVVHNTAHQAHRHNRAIRHIKHSHIVLCEAKHSFSGHFVNQSLKNLEEVQAVAGRGRVVGRGTHVSF